MDKQKALETALQQLEKQFGKGTVMRLGENPAMQVEAISTGSLSLDVALGIGGVPRGRIIEVYGPESSGKTTLALHVVASAQKRGGEAAFIDAEHALDPVYAKALGVDTDSLLVSQPDTGEQALEIAEALVRSGAVDVLVVDRLSLATVSGLLKKYQQGRWQECGDKIHHFRCRSAEILCERESVVNVDGEALYTKRAEIEVVPKALRFFYPRGLTYSAEKFTVAT